MLLKDRVVLVCGAGPGMGRKVAVLAAREGADLVLAARTPATLQATAQLVEAEGRQALCIPTDATDPAAVQRMVDQAIARYGRIDVAVHSILPPHLFKRVLELEDSDLDGWKRSVDVSIFAALLVARAVGKVMAQAGRGSIVFGTATSGFQGYPAVSAHAAGKAGIHSLAQCFASEFGPLGIRVNCVAVGVIDGETARTMPHDLPPQVLEDIHFAVDASRGALRRNVSEEEVARAVLFLASDASSGTTGQILAVDGGRYFH